eukprot:TRINITY_DN5943_c0_g1_i1.p2 TRINITY_DN5943_c0_g1~~TRINITY_DN5943_c0_g1_i1.p2  ORF type:complete len:75 (+),score=4.16 TRINITY_DN5943_c0_g1_i1:172-396(+)
MPHSANEDRDTECLRIAISFSTISEMTLPGIEVSPKAFAAICMIPRQVKNIRNMTFTEMHVANPADTPYFEPIS